MEPVLSESEVIKFLSRRGGKSTNHELVSNFKGILNDPVYKVEARLKFKDIINIVAKVEDIQGVKYIKLKSEYYDPSGLEELHSDNNDSLSDQTTSGYSSPYAQGYQPYWRYRLSSNARQLSFSGSESSLPSDLIRSPSSKNNNGNDQFFSSTPQRLSRNNSITEYGDNKLDLQKTRSSLNTSPPRRISVPHYSENERSSYGEGNPLPQERRNSQQDLPMRPNSIPLQESYGRDKVYASAEQRLGYCPTPPNRQTSSSAQEDFRQEFFSPKEQTAKHNLSRDSLQSFYSPNEQPSRRDFYSPNEQSSRQDFYSPNEQPSRQDFYSPNEQPLRQDLFPPRNQTSPQNFHTPPERNVRQNRYSSQEQLPRQTFYSPHEPQRRSISSPLEQRHDIYLSPEQPWESPYSQEQSSRRNFYSHEESSGRSTLKVQDETLQDEPLYENFHSPRQEPHHESHSQDRSSESSPKPRYQGSYSLEQSSNPPAPPQRFTSGESHTYQVGFNSPQDHDRPVISKQKHHSSTDLSRLSLEDNYSSQGINRRLLLPEDKLPSRSSVCSAESYSSLSSAVQSAPEIRLPHASDPSPSFLHSVSSSTRNSEKVLTEVGVNCPKSSKCPELREKHKQPRVESEEGSCSDGSVICKATGANTQKLPVTVNRDQESNIKQNDLSASSTDEAKFASDGKVKERVRHLDDLEKHNRITRRSFSPLAAGKENSVKAHGTDDEASITMIDPKLRKLWFVAAAQSDYHKLVSLLKKEPKLAGLKDVASTALHWAAKHGDANVVKLIAGAYKVNPNIRSGYTSLHLAALYKHEPIVHLLVHTYGANPAVRDYSGKKANQYPPNFLDVVAGAKKSERKPLKPRPAVKEPSGGVFTRIGSLNLRKSRRSAVFASVRSTGRLKNWNSSDNVHEMLKKSNNRASNRNKKGSKNYIMEKKSDTDSRNDSDSDGAYGFHLK